MKKIKQKEFSKKEFINTFLASRSTASLTELKRWLICRGYKSCLNELEIQYMARFIHQGHVISINEEPATVYVGTKEEAIKFCKELQKKGKVKAKTVDIYQGEVNDQFKKSCNLL